MRPVDLRLAARCGLKRAPRGAASASAVRVRRSGGPCCSCPRARSRGPGPGGSVSPAAAAWRPTLVDQRLELIQLRWHPPAPVDRLRSGLRVALDRPPVASQQPPDLGVHVALARERPCVHQFLLADQPAASRVGRRHGRERQDCRRQSRRRRRPGSDRAHAREGLVAPPGLLIDHARGQPLEPHVDLHDWVITDLHFSNGHRQLRRTCVMAGAVSAARPLRRGPGRPASSVCPPIPTQTTHPAHVSGRQILIS